LDTGCFGWISLFECGEAFAETGCVLLGYGEDANATLGASGFAYEVVAAALVGVGYCAVYDLDQGLGQRTSKEMTREFR
jgi:hypothetical protein